MKDRLFLLITIALLALFAVSMLENIPLNKKESVDVSGIMTRLEDRGLEPKEADYYQVMDE